MAIDNECCNYTKLSNLLNLMVQKSDCFKYYHFGWLVDADKNILNNFNKEGITGKLYPAVHWNVPSSSFVFGTGVSTKETFNMCLYFEDLECIDNKQAAKNKTKLELWNDLRCKALDFYYLLKKLLCDVYHLGSIKNSPTMEFDDTARMNKIVSVKMCFDIDLNTPYCKDIDTSDYTESLPCCDLENYCNCTIQ